MSWWSTGKERTTQMGSLGESGNVWLDPRWSPSTGLRAARAWLFVACVAFTGCIRPYYAVEASDLRSALGSGSDPSAPMTALRDEHTPVRVRVRLAHRVTPFWTADAPASLLDLSSIRLSEVTDARYAPYLERVGFEGSPGRGRRIAGYIGMTGGSVALAGSIVLLASSLRCLNRLETTIANVFICGYGLFFGAVFTAAFGVVTAGGIVFSFEGHGTDAVREIAP